MIVDDRVERTWGWPFWSDTVVGLIAIACSVNRQCPMKSPSRVLPKAGGHISLFDSAEKVQSAHKQGKLEALKCPTIDDLNASRVFRSPRKSELATFSAESLFAFDVVPPPGAFQLANCSFVAIHCWRHDRIRT
jgi:hypothetical protein